MRRRTPRSTLIDTLLPDTTRFRSDVADGAGSAACRQAAGAAAISAASSRCLSMGIPRGGKPWSLARGVVDAGVPKVGRLRPDRSTCGSGRGLGAAPTYATWSGCRGLVGSEEHTSELQSLM